MPEQKVRIPVRPKESEDLGAGLNLDRYAMVDGPFGTTYFLCLGMPRGVCCRDIRSISLVQWAMSHEKAQMEFRGATQHHYTRLTITNMKYVQYGSFGCIPSSC